MKKRLFFHNYENKDISYKKRYSFMKKMRFFHNYKKKTHKL